MPLNRDWGLHPALKATLYPLYKKGQLAFIPFANLWLLCDMADMETWFLIIFLVPFVNVVLLGIVWWRIAENTNKPGPLGLLMLVPVLMLEFFRHPAILRTLMTLLAPDDACGNLLRYCSGTALIKS